MMLECCYYISSSGLDARGNPSSESKSGEVFPGATFETEELATRVKSLVRLLGVRVEPKIGKGVYTDIVQVAVDHHVNFRPLDFRALLVDMSEKEMLEFHRIIRKHRAGD